MNAPEVAITIQNPWAVAIAADGPDAKPVENRGRPIHPKHIWQPIGIHAAQAVNLAAMSDWRIRRLFGPRFDIDQQPRGAVIAVATLTDCHPAAYGGAPGKTCCEPWGEARYNGGACFHLVRADVVRLPEPVPARGMQAVPWRMPADVVEQIAAQLADMVAVR
jgi:hypothetical protein